MYSRAADVRAVALAPPGALGARTFCIGATGAGCTVRQLAASALRASPAAALAAKLAVLTVC